MKTKFEYVYFTKVYRIFGSNAWYCYNIEDSNIIGVIKWSVVLNQYHYLPYYENTYVAKCLIEISNFITILNNQ